MVFGTPNCTVIPDQVPSDPGIAGAGVLLSSTITACVTLLMSGSLVIQELFQSRRRNLKTHDPNPSKIRRKLLNGYSDQQIIVGIGVQSIGLAQAHLLVPYHFFIIWMLSLLSMATHNATLLTLVRDFQRDKVLRWLRQFLMFVNLALSCVFGAFVLQSKARGLPNTLPIACSWTFDQDAVQGEDQEIRNNTAAGLDYFGTIITVFGNCVVFGLATWYLQSRLQRFYRSVQLVGLVLMGGIAIGATVRVFLLSQAFGTPDVKLADQGEKIWSFGQLLSMLLLVLPVISAIEILRGEIAMAPPVQEEDREVLYNGELDTNPKIINRF